MQVDRLLCKPPLAAMLLIAVVSACSEHDGISGSGGGGGTAPLALSGTAATGAPIGNAAITAKCAGQGASYNTLTDAGGRYSLSVGAAPCVIRVSFGAPEQSLYAIADAAGTLDISPFTDLVVAALGHGTPASFYAGFPGNAGAITPAALAAASDLVKRRLANFGVNASALDLLHQNFAPHSGDAYDDHLEALKTQLQTQATTLAALEDDVAHNRDQPEQAAVVTPTISFADSGDGLVRLTFAPAQSGVTYDVHYDLVATPAPGAPPPTPAFSVLAASSPLEIGGLTSDKPYYFYVTAHNGTESRTSTQVTVTPHLYGVSFKAYANSADPHPTDGSAGSFYSGAAYLRTIDGRDVYTAVKSTREIMSVRLTNTNNSVDRIEAVLPTADTTAVTLNAVASGKGVLIAAGDQGRILYSQNGFDWQDISVAIAPPNASNALPPTGASYHSISYADGKFVLAGKYATAATGSPADLLVTLDFNPEDSTCTTACSSTAPYAALKEFLSPAISGGGNGLQVVSHGNNGFVAMAGSGLVAPNADDFSNTYLQDGSTYVYTSSDGVQWLRNSVSEKNKFPDRPVRMIYALGRYFGLMPFNGGLYTSTDGLVWVSTANVSFVGSHPHDLVYGPGQFVSVDQLSDTFLSKDGKTWKEHDSGLPASGGASCLAFGNGRYVAFGNYVYYSE